MRARGRIGDRAAALATIFVTPPVATSSTGTTAAAYALAFDINSYRRALSNSEGLYRESALEFMKQVIDGHCP